MAVYPAFWIAMLNTVDFGFHGEDLTITVAPFERQISSTGKRRLPAYPPSCFQAGVRNGNQAYTRKPASCTYPHKFHFLPDRPSLQDWHNHIHQPTCKLLPCIGHCRDDVQVDPSITFAQIGGLDSYIKALKEMVFLPLVYPELFERFHVQPPRGVLFYGPPGVPWPCHGIWVSHHQERAAQHRSSVSGRALAVSTTGFRTSPDCSCQIPVHMVHVSCCLIHGCLDHIGGSGTYPRIALLVHPSLL